MRTLGCNSLSIFKKAFVGAFFTLLTTNALAYRNVSWNARSEGGNLAFARALVALAKTQTTVKISEPVHNPSDIVAAECSVDVRTPLIGDQRMATPGNQARCDAKTQSGPNIQIIWDLSTEVFIAYGTRTFPRGFSFEGKTALAMFYAFEDVKNDGPELTHLDFDDVTLSSAFTVYQFIEYTIFSLPRQANGDSDGYSLLNCAQEFNYARGAPRPENPDLIRCDFVYCLSEDQGGSNQCYEYVGP